MMGSSASLPPPSGAPSNSDGRNDLMASIRAAGGFGTLKTSGKLRDAETSSPASPHHGTAEVGAAAAAGAAGAAGGNLASSLADVLKQRKQAMQSDDEDEDDDEWD
jgi:Wiskott-Aldrich syndrome protein